MRTITNPERRARLGIRHRLAAPATDVVDAARSTMGLHSSDPATVYLSGFARVPGFTTSDFEQSIYENRSLIRLLGMRRTMFVEPVELTPIIHYSSTLPQYPGQLKRAARMVEESGLARDGTAWVERVSELTLDALRLRGEATAVELTEDVPELGERLEMLRRDGSSVGQFGASTRILFLLAVAGHIVRGRPKGSWVSSLYRWVPIETWLGHPLEPMDRPTAQKELLARWLPRFGPATEIDIKWWTGWPVTQVRSALTAIGAIEVAVETGPAWVAGDDEEPPDDPGPWARLLPSLDPATMGWKERDWYLSDHASEVFDRNGNAGQTIWVEGRVVGGWAQRRSGEIALQLLEDVGADASAEINRRAGELEEWLDGVVVIPRFGSPLDRRLASA